MDFFCLSSFFFHIILHLSCTGYKNEDFHNLLTSMLIFLPELFLCHTQKRWKGTSKSRNLFLYHIADGLIHHANESEWLSHADNKLCSCMIMSKHIAIFLWKFQSNFFSFRLEFLCCIGKEKELSSHNLSILCLMWWARLDRCAVLLSSFAHSKSFLNCHEFWCFLRQVWEIFEWIFPQVYAAKKITVWKLNEFLRKTV